MSDSRQNRNHVFWPCFGAILLEIAPPMSSTPVAAHAARTPEADQRIPFVDLQAQSAHLRVELAAAMDDVLQRGDFIHGAAVRRFEAAFAEFLGVRHAIGVANGLDALRLSLLTLKIGPGDEVILPATTFVATALAVSAVGAEPVLVDPDPATLNLTAERVASAITPRTAAILPVHFAGRAVEMTPLVELASQRGLAIVEDAAQAHGARVDGRCTGSFGTAGCFSFYPSKNLGAFGDGGMVVTNDDRTADAVRTLGNYGQVTKHEHSMLGVNSRLDTLQAAVLLTKLPHLESWNQARRRLARQYREELAEAGEFLDLPAPESQPNSHVYHLFAVQTRQREALRAFLERHHIQTAIHYPKPIHRHQAYAALNRGSGSFPVSEKHADETLSLPMYPEMTESQVSSVCRLIRMFFFESRVN
jgi:dTDP-4-amino-4,6-dideoxygalactose transaminase